MGRPSGGERGVSELYGTLLVIGLTVVVGIFLVGTGTFVVQQLTSDSEEEVSREVMYEINDQIDALVQGSSSVYQASSVTLPQQGSDALSVSDEGTLTVIVETHSEYADRTAKQNGTQEYSLGSIRHESEGGVVTVYQGGGIWEQSSNGDTVRLRSQPYLDFTGNRLDFQVVDVSDLDLLQSGETLEFERRPSTGDASSFEDLLRNLTDDIYNTNVRVPVNVTITIESQYAEAWQAYAEEEMSEPLDPSDTILDAENETLTLEFGTIGEFVSRTQSPTFGDDRIVYSGTSDYAYKYYNRTVGTIDGNQSAFSVTDPTDDADHQLALYNASGRWLLYDSASGEWEDPTGAPVDPDATAAIERVDDGGNDTYQIKPPAELSGPAASTPVCIVDGNRSETLRLLDQSGADCLETMVGVPEDAVDPVELAPRFDVTIANPGEVPDQLNITDDESFELDVTVENIGEASGSTPLGVYAINESNNASGDLSEAYLLGGETNVTLDPGETETVDSVEVPAQTGMGGQNWTFFATSGEAGAGIDFAGEFVEVPDPAVTFNITDIEPDSNDLIVGQTTDVEVTVEETEDSIGGSLDLDALLLANGTPSAVKDFEIDGGETETVTVEWTPAEDGSVTLNASLVAGSADYDSSIANVNETTVSVTPAYSEFEIEITGTNSPVTEGDPLTVDAVIENAGTINDTQDVRLEAFGGGAVGLVEDVDLDPGESESVTLTWNTVVGDAGTGEIKVLSGDDNDTASVEITEKTRDPVDVAFVIDETGSMGGCSLFGCYGNDPYGERIDATKNAIDALDQSIGDRAGWVRYSTEFDDAEIKQGITSDLADLKSDLGTYASGSTNISAGIDKGEQALISAGSSNQKYMIVLTDGKHNQGPPYPDDFAEDVSDNVTIYTVGFGDFDEGVLTDVATEDGEFIEAENAEELTDVFEDVIDDVTETTTFDVEVTGTNAPVVATETVNVTAEVTNTGATDGKGVVSLRNFAGTAVDSTTVNLTQNESETVTFEWDPADGIVPEGDDQRTDNVSILTVDDEANESVTVEAPPEVTVANLDVSDPVATESSVTVNATLSVNSSTEATVVLSVVDPAGRETQVDQNTTNLSSGETPVDLSWDVGQQPAYEVIVETRDDRADSNVTVESAAFDVSIDNVSPDAVEAGDPMDVTVTVENKGTDDREVFLWLEDEAGNERDLETDLTIEDGDTETVTLTWNTVFGDGNEEPQNVTAVVAEPGVTERTKSPPTEVTIEPITTEIDDATIFKSDVAIGIDLTAIETSTSNSD